MIAGSDFQKVLWKLECVELREAVCFLTPFNPEATFFRELPFERKGHILNAVPEHSDDEMEQKWHREFLYRRCNVKGKPDGLTLSEVKLANFLLDYFLTSLAMLTQDRDPFDAICNLTFPLMITRKASGGYTQSFEGLKLSKKFGNKIYLFNRLWLASEMKFLNLLPNSALGEPIEGQAYLDYASDDKRKRNIIIQTLAHFLLTCENHNLKWNQTKVAGHDLLKTFGVVEDFSSGDLRVIKDLVKVLIPEECRNAGNPDNYQYCSEILKITPKHISEVFYEDEKGKKLIDFCALRIAGRTVALAYILHKNPHAKGDMREYYDEIISFPTFRSLLDMLEPSQQIIFKGDVSTFLGNLSNIRIRCNG